MQNSNFKYFDRVVIFFLAIATSTVNGIQCYQCGYDSSVKGSDPTCLTNPTAFIECDARNKNNSSHLMKLDYENENQTMRMTTSMENVDECMWGIAKHRDIQQSIRNIRMCVPRTGILPREEDSCFQVEDQDGNDVPFMWTFCVCSTNLCNNKVINFDSDDRENDESGTSCSSPHPFIFGVMLAILIAPVQ